MPDLHIADIITLVDQLYDSEMHTNKEGFNDTTYHMIGYTIEYYLRNKKLPRPPYSPLEYTALYRSIEEIFEKIISLSGNVKQIRNVIHHLSSDQLLMLQGMRITEGSKFDVISFPQPSFLIELANHEYNEYLTDLARARAKHSFRCETAYWGKISGSPNEQNEESNVILVQLLKRFTWWNYFEHFKHGLVFELRDTTGHGMRWSITNSTFLGLIEPIDPNLGRTFWTSREDFHQE